MSNTNRTITSSGFLRLLSIISIVAFITSCSNDTNLISPNKKPQITQLTAQPQNIALNSETTLTCVAADDDGDKLQISWNSKRGIFPNGSVGPIVKWISGNQPGLDTINVIVSDGSNTIQGKIIVNIGSLPSIPTLISPINNSVDAPINPSLIWNNISNAESYYIQVSNTITFDQILYEQQGVKVAFYQLANLSLSSKYYWRVRSHNIFGYSNWSNTFFFQTANPPNKVLLLDPIDNSKGISLNPVLTWQSTQNAKLYRLQVSKNNSFTEIIFDNALITSPGHQITNLEYATTYFWRVSATNEYGSSLWSNTWSFFTVNQEIGLFAGTWKLSKITVNINGANIDLTPQQADTQMAIVAGADGSYKSTTIKGSVTTIEYGTWKINNSLLEINYVDGSRQVLEFTINGNKCYIKTTVSTSGQVLPAILEFVKQ